MNRRHFLAAAGAAGAAGLAGYTTTGEKSNRLSSFRDGPSVGLELVAEGFWQPLALQTARDDRFRYIADKSGKVFLQVDGNLRSEPFLDVSDQLVELSTWEQGFLGFELHPNFESNGKCYVRYSAPPRDGTPDHFSHTFVLSEFRAESDLRRVDPDSERSLLEIPEPGHNHNAGSIIFGPDGYLYVGVGNGGKNKKGREVGRADDWYWLNAGGNGQDVSANLLGSILRIDVDTRTDGEYAIPDGNPLVGKKGLDEHYAWGFRNPYRMSFTDGDLYVGDVGAADVEEVSKVERGGNYGWNVKEGEWCHSNRLSVAALANLPWFEKTYPVCPDETPEGQPLQSPVIAYPHRKNGEPFGRAVVGGYLYTNETVSSIRDTYIFADLKGPGSGIYAATPTEDGLWPMASVEVTSGPEMRNRFVLSFGRDSDGELYVLTTQFAEGTGAVYRMIPPES